MDLTTLIVISFSYLVVGLVTASTGGTSLFTVPLLIVFGVAPRVAVATNMFALVFYSLGGSWGFRAARRKISKLNLAAMFLLTALGSSLGATLVVGIDERLLEKLIAGFAALMVGSLIWSDELGVEADNSARGLPLKLTGLGLVFLAGIYGGFFSGGYVTILTYIFVLTLGHNFIQAAFLSKVMNVCSSTIATLIFYYSGLLNLELGLAAAAGIFLGSYLGAKYAVAQGSRWIRKIFIFVTIILLLKLLFF